MQCLPSTLVDNPSSTNDFIHSDSTTETLAIDDDSNYNVFEEEDEEYFIFNGRGTEISWMRYYFHTCNSRLQYMYKSLS